jgi:putative phage-type endonuclease
MTPPPVNRVPSPEIALSTIEEHGTEHEWLEVRRSAIGASEAPILLGVSPFKSPMALFAEKLELVERDAQSEAMRWGQLLEPALAAKYGEETGHSLHDRGRYTLRRSRDIPWMVATLDREITKAGERPVPAVLELKMRSYAAPGTWEDEPPIDVLVQVQHQLAVTGWPWAAVAVLLAGRTFKRFVVERHEAFIAKLCIAEVAFMERLQTQTPPEVDASEATRAVLRALYPREEPGLVVNLPGQAVEWDTQRLEAQAELKKWATVKDLAENQLKAALGEAEFGVLPNGTSYTYKASERAGYVVPPTIVRTLRRKEPK